MDIFKKIWAVITGLFGNTKFQIGKDNNSQEATAKNNSYVNQVSNGSIFHNNYYYDRLEKKNDNIDHDLSEYDIERLIKWTSADNPTFYSGFYTGGGAFYGLGAKNQYEVKAGKEMAEWNDFFEKLIKLGFVEKGYKTDGNPTYELKKAAYDFVDPSNPKGRE